MLNNLQVFRNTEFGELGVFVAEGKELFPATECGMLGYTNPEKAICNHCKGVHEMVTPSAGGMQKQRFSLGGAVCVLINLMPRVILTQRHTRP